MTFVIFMSVIGWITVNTFYVIAVIYCVEYIIFLLNYQIILSRENRGTCGVQVVLLVVFNQGLHI